MHLQHTLGRRKIEALTSYSPDTDTIIIPLYILLCYVFDNNELSMEDLQNATEETSQYSLHVVGRIGHAQKSST